MTESKPRDPKLTSPAPNAYQVANWPPWSQRLDDADLRLEILADIAESSKLNAPRPLC